jgi:hypothetical protein
MAQYWFRRLSDWVAMPNSGLSDRRYFASLEDVTVTNSPLLNFYLRKILMFFLICKLIYFDVLCFISFKENLPEDGHNGWPKHVGGYSVYNTIPLHICIYAGWYISNNKSSAHGHESPKNDVFDGYVTDCFAGLVGTAGCPLWNCFYSLTGYPKMAVELDIWPKI